MYATRDADNQRFLKAVEAECNERSEQLVSTFLPVDCFPDDVIFYRHRFSYLFTQHAKEISTDHMHAHITFTLRHCNSFEKLFIQTTLLMRSFRKLTGFEI